MDPGRFNRRSFLVSIGSASVLTACGGGAYSPAQSGPPTLGTAPTAAPIGAPANSVAFTIVNNNMSIISSSIMVYVFGQDTGGNWQFLKPDWTLAPWAQTAAFPGIPFYAGGSGSGTTSQTFFLPKLISARIYI